MRITASLLVCCTAAGVAVGALTLEPIHHAPSRPAAAATTSTTLAPNVRSSRHSSPSAAATAAMTIRGFQFATVRAAPGATVTVTNGDAADHTVSATDGSFDAAVAAGGQGSFLAPSTPGTYNFVCRIHPAMTGSLVVA